MKDLDVIYIIRCGLGGLTAMICVLLKINDVLLGATVGILIYYTSDRLLKQIFIGKVDNESEITKTGIGIYIITWIFTWILIYTLLQDLGY